MASSHNTTPREPGAFYQVDVAVLEFYDGQSTVWVHDANGHTILRIKCTGGIKVNSKCENPAVHSDVVVDGPMEICVPCQEAASLD